VVKKSSPNPRSRWRASSARWLKRNEKDPYVIAAKKAGFSSRAAYKLLEIDAKTNLLKNARIIIDLGASPGGWSSVIASGNALQIIAVDKVPFTPPANVTFINADLDTPLALEQINEIIRGKADVVLSDVAPNFCGHHATDRIRSEELALTITSLAVELLAVGGSFLLKLFSNPTDNLQQLINLHFESSRRLKPPSSRKESGENYLLATGFNPSPR